MKNHSYQFIVLLALFFLVACDISYLDIEHNKNLEQVNLTSLPEVTITLKESGIIQKTEEVDREEYTFSYFSRLNQKFLDFYVEGLKVAENENDADILFEIVDKPTINTIFERFYVVTVPFSQNYFDITYHDLVDIWQGTFDKGIKLWASEKESDYLVEMLGPADLENVFLTSVAPDVCLTVTCLHIEPFEDLYPGERMLSIDQLTLINKENFIENYPFVFRIQAVVVGENTNALRQVFSKKITNFDLSKLTSVMLTGTTALVRYTALRMEEEGVLYPAKDIGVLLASADITHISNEVPFYSKCPPAVPLRKEMRFCSSPGYVQLIQAIGADVIELTGNHLLDWGPDAFIETLDIYQQLGVKTFGGGKNLTEAEIPLKIISNGNKIAFIGCNVPGPDNDFAKDNRPGALSCSNYPILDKIKQLTGDGYQVIVTFQHYEFDTFQPNTLLKNDFFAAAEAGAVIVSGSQAHFPQGFDFVDNSFIHYGVGNLFFDQMSAWQRKATLDVHYFYAGQYINTEIIPIILEDYAKPRLMLPNERSQFMQTLLENSFYYEKK